MEHRPHDRDRARFPVGEFEALGFAVTPILPPPQPTRTEDLPDWPRHEPSMPEFGSMVLRWITVLLVLGLVGLALVTPSLNGAPPQAPAYQTD